MAQRDITSYRTVTEQVAPRVAAEQEAYSGPSTANQLLNAAADIGSQIIKAGQEAKITENYSKAALEVNQLQQQFEIDNESDPFNKQALETFKQNRQAIFDKYGQEISPFFKKPYQDNVREMGVKVDAEQQAWGYKQTRENTKNSLNTAMSANLSQALIDGQNFGNSDQTEFGGLINWADSKSKLIDTGDKILGHETTTKMLENYDDDYLKTVISGVSDTNPVKALKMLDDPNVQKSFRDPEHYMEMQKAVKARAYNLQQVTGEKQTLNVLKNENSILSQSLQSPISYAALKAEFDKNPGMSAASKSYFLKANGYTKEDGSDKLNPAEQYKYKEELYSQIQATTIKPDFSADDVSKLQEKVYQGMTDHALTDAEGASFLNDLITPLATKKEESMKNYANYGYPFYSGDDLGFGNIQKMYDESIALPIPLTKAGEPQKGTAGAQVENARNKIKLMDYYRDSLQAEAVKEGITYGQIPDQPRKKARAMYKAAQDEAKKLYMLDKYPELPADEPLPNNIIPVDGGKIFTGAQTGAKADTSVKLNRVHKTDAQGNSAWVYYGPDGKVSKVEEIP